MIDLPKIIKCIPTRKNANSEITSIIKEYGVDMVRIFGDISSSECTLVICDTPKQAESINILIMEMYYTSYLPKEPIYFNVDEITPNKRGTPVGLCLPSEIYSHLFDDFCKLDEEDNYEYAKLDDFISTPKLLLSKYKQKSFKKIKFD